ncbi:YbfB/YjiJ family MFS transporter [Reinekea blandensis]|uniref:Major facilitator superfamily (MFS) profile domain-containing protein n=1 Tax=Reinekea blandensis MED297 TaxID=314283 RepID=A4BFL9_9GAMM|nr:YbfB/YjiJ family MFS transporter [Reinekea blandensis]EAR09114.1 hypothetical protein MED297_17268 [Reinekea sp. MED297] [Reinekea blandensis MED297]
MDLLNRNHPIAILLAGILALIVGVGAARFAFTALLPAMLENTLSLRFSGVLASLNYVGYLSGAIFAIFLKDLNAKVRFFRIGMVLCVLTTLVLATTTDEWVWLVSRIIAGFGAAMALVVGSAIVMTKLNMADKTKAMGIHFSGIGFSILVTDLLSRLVMQFGGSWQHAWLILTLMATAAAGYSMYILRVEPSGTEPAKATSFDFSVFTRAVWVLVFAYFTEGLGMVVQGTFLPDIINSLEGLEGFGGYAWTAVGLAGIPSCILWMRAAHRFGSVTIIIVTMLLQVAGILIPVLTNNPWLNLLSGLLFGGTFVALVALFMTLGGKLAGHHPVVVMGAITTAYGIGQVSGPLYSVALVEHFGSYSYALVLTAAFVAFGAMLMAVNRRHF